MPVAEPGKIVHLVLLEAPGEMRAFRLPFFAVGQGFHAFAHCAVLQNTRSGHHIARRRGDAHLVVAVFVIEFTLVEVRENIPAVHIVHSRLGKPLGNLISGRIVPESGKLRRNPDIEVNIQGKRGSRRQGTWQNQAHNVFMIRMGFNRKVDAVFTENEFLVPAALVFLCIEDARLETVDLLFCQCALVVAVSVGVYMKPDFIQGIRAVVHILDALHRLEHMRGVVEFHPDGMVHLLLPGCLPYGLGSGLTEKAAGWKEQK